MSKKAKSTWSTHKKPILVDLKTHLCYQGPVGSGLYPSIDHHHHSFYFRPQRLQCILICIHPYLLCRAPCSVSIILLMSMQNIFQDSLYIFSTMGISMIAAELTGLPFNLPKSWVLFRDYCIVVKLCMHCPSLLLCSLKRICLSFQQYPHKNIYDQSSCTTAWKWNVTIKQGDQ